MKWFGGGGEMDGRTEETRRDLDGVAAEDAARGDGEPHLPPDVCELGKEQRKVEGELQDVVVMDVHRQRLRTHTHTQ